MVVTMMGNLSHLRTQPGSVRVQTQDLFGGLHLTSVHPMINACNVLMYNTIFVLIGAHATISAPPGRL